MNDVVKEEEDSVCMKFTVVFIYAWDVRARMHGLVCVYVCMCVFL